VASLADLALFFFSGDAGHQPGGMGKSPPSAAAARRRERTDVQSPAPRGKVRGPGRR